ncbi:hypothetical protein GF339_07535 [candidate division KSB3 bacterium]|uniref:Uncharacterized protein n=1 Tax=candidate division KSB3 bacterium TaxID=2044937 RepID=A0A9D5JUD3_9BACT|nr:hypothetical protein [candidate division KSB3 bacterium]MBD3324422.1 hypothetical protein [candidate division KSB3 bacterium]
MLKYCISCLLVGLLMLNAAPVLAENEKVLSLIPEDDEIAGWLRDGEAAIATDLDSLTGLINGAAPFYIDHGTQIALFQDYIKDDVYLMLEMYQVDTPQHAQQVYAESYSDESQPLERIGTEGRIVGGLIGVYLVEYWQKTFFVRLTISDKSQHSKEAVVTFAQFISENIE